jgi:hypothetical protein
VRGTAATGYFKHCRYSVWFTHHQIEFHCLLIEKEDNFAELLPGAYAFELSASEHLAAAPTHQNDVNPSVHHDFDLAAAFALLDVPPADVTDFSATHPIPPKNEQQRYDLPGNERLSMSNLDPLGAEEQRCTGPCAPHCGTPLRPKQLVSGAHSDAYPFLSQHPQGWSGPSFPPPAVRYGYTGLPSRDAWHPAAPVNPLSYPRGESSTSWQAPRRQDSESDLLRREFFEPSHDWGRMLEELDQVHAALDTWHPSTPHNYPQAESTTSRQVPRHQNRGGAIHRRLFFEPSDGWGPMLEEIEQGHVVTVRPGGWDANGQVRDRATMS